MGTVYHKENFIARFTSRRENESVDFAQKYLFNNTLNKDNLDGGSSNQREGSMDQDTLQQFNNEEQDESSFSQNELTNPLL